MGTIKQGILGGFSGKVGTVVGSTWKSVHYMRALAVSFSDPRTEKQKNQRSKFTAAVNFTKAMTPFLRFGYKEFSGEQSFGDTWQSGTRIGCHSNRKRK